MTNRPNLLFLFSDHQIHYRHGWDSGPRIQRPYFDRLAAGGVSFGRAYSASPTCGPARRTVLTGLFPHTHGEVRNEVNAPMAHQVYLDALTEQGYDNWYYGKWHAGPGTALDHGCQGFSVPEYGNPYATPEYRAYLHERGLPEAEMRVDRSLGWTRDIPERELAQRRYNYEYGHVSGVQMTPKETHESFFLAQLACDRLRELAAADQPFSLRVDFWGPHQPYYPTQEYADLYDPGDIPEYGSFRDDLSGKPDVYRAERNAPLGVDGRLVVPSVLPWSDWQLMLSRAYAHVTMVDAAGGLILDALDELGLAENTLVIWTADHGDAIACHGGHFDKRSYMPEEVTRIPMAMRLPAVIPAGQVSERLVSLMDVAPTLLDAAGTGFSDEVAGSSLLPIGADPSADWRTDLMCETHGHGEHHIGRLLVDDRYKYVWNQGQMDELYDLDQDPYELANLIDDPAHRDLLADMRSRLLSWQEATGDGHRADF